ncbi:hypothetical protein BpHYR1_010151 [Brachionus plicatilis]|uniref:Uncharacterized protein n=1 Tax=Brachionus plicatilis TaxID=10195 RepID=A0A3M7PUK5_BRAPC|nr:hypothetical protein BpHYR1_010151 [Brachionus plicatilis]
MIKFFVIYYSGDLITVFTKNYGNYLVEEITFLGYKIDQNLNFSNFACSVSLVRLFYLSTSTFILPYFDYCSTLLCYFSKEAIIKLAKKKYGLYAFQHRILDRMNSENLIEPTSKSVNVLIGLYDMGTSLLINLEIFFNLE